jgi:predicted MPP superfamily phosphohydrolase
MNLKVKDFSRRKFFPGTTGNSFDLLLHLVERLVRVPHGIFAGMLLTLAIIPTINRWPLTLILWGFFLTDWLLLAYLPRKGRSFGPAKPAVLMLAVLRMIPAILPIPLMIALEILGTLLVIYGFWIEPHRIRVTRQVFRTPKWKSGRPLRLLHLGDLHVERLTDRERTLNTLVASLKPDIILFSGDFLNLSYLHDTETWAAARSIIQEWKAPLGVYAVRGSPAVDLPDVLPELIDGLPVCLLDHDRITLKLDDQAFDLIGLACTHKPFLDAPRLETLLQEDSGRFTILLYHSPDIAPNASSLNRCSGIDLQLSGHTHGGQVRLPILGALYTGSLYGRRFEKGRYSIGGMTLYITRGIGMEGAAAPRVRFLCPPEVILWEIGASLTHEEPIEGTTSMEKPG